MSAELVSGVPKKSGIKNKQRSPKFSKKTVNRLHPSVWNNIARPIVPAPVQTDVERHILNEPPQTKKKLRLFKSLNESVRRERPESKCRNVRDALVMFDQLSETKAQIIARMGLSQ